MKRGLYDLIVSEKYYAKFLRTNNIEDAVRAVQHPKDGEKYKYQDYSQEEQKKAVEVCQKHNQGKVALLRWREKPTVYKRNMAFTVMSREGQSIPPELLQAVIESMEKQIARTVQYPKEKNQWAGVLKRWRNKPTAYNLNMAFILLKREKQSIPPELLQAVLKSMDKQIAHYETQHTTIGSFDKRMWHFSKLKSALAKRKGFKLDVFKEHAVEWEIPVNDKNDNNTEPWELLMERYKTRRKREKNKLEKRLEEPHIRKREKKEIIEELNRIQKKRGGS